MTEEKAQKIWDEYYQRIKNRRLAQATILWSEMESKGVTNDTVLALDFSHFAKNETI